MITRSPDAAVSPRARRCARVESAGAYTTRASVKVRAGRPKYSVETITVSISSCFQRVDRSWSVASFSESAELKTTETLGRPVRRPEYSLTVAPVKDSAFAMGMVNRRVFMR